MPAGFDLLDVLQEAGAGFGGNVDEGLGLGM
jgi:hypothetical protein